MVKHARTRTEKFPVKTTFSKANLSFNGFRNSQWRNIYLRDFEV